MKPESDRIWEESFTVRNYETAFDGRLSPVALCNILQEVAGNNARHLGFSVEHFEAENLTWVLARMLLRMERYPTWGEDLRIQTWPSGVERIFATRDFLVYPSDGLPIGRVTTAWLLMNLRTRRPARVPASLSAMRRPLRERALIDDLSPLACIDASEEPATNIRVQLGDLDVNRHVNNARFVQWILETLPIDFQTGHTLAEMLIHFKAEAVYGDEISPVALKSTDDMHVFDHCVRRVSDGRELAAARTRWVPADD